MAAVAMADEEPLTPEQMSPAGRAAVAATSGLLGAGLVALAAGVMPADASDFHAPHWVAGACGFMFMFAGFLVIVPATMPHTKNFLGAALLTLFAAVPGWIGFGSDPRVFGGSVSFGSMTSTTHPGEIAGRVAFGFFAVLIGLCAAYIWWRWLRSLFSADDDASDDSASKS